MLIFAWRVSGSLRDMAAAGVPPEVQLRTPRSGSPFGSIGKAMSAQTLGAI